MNSLVYYCALSTVLIQFELYKFILIIAYYPSYYLIITTNQLEVEVLATNLVSPERNQN